MSEELLVRFLTRTYTQEELLEVEKWISEDQANADWLFEIEKVWSLKDELRYSDRKEIKIAYRRFVRASSRRRRKQMEKRQLFHGWLKYAAAIAIVCLTAANIYQAFRNKSSDEVATSIIEVPVGNRVVITLADSTKVWLNSGSILSYPANFNIKNRVVCLDGEGYFEVTADKEHPFVVNTKMLEVKALGTKFNVQAYPSDDIAVSLLEGQLNVRSDRQAVLMAANELVTWSKGAGLVRYKNKPVQSAAKWISGEFIFVNERMEDIAKVLERRFGVTIIIDTPKMKGERFSCRTPQGATLEQVLKLLKGTKKMNYSIREQTVHVK